MSSSQMKKYCLGCVQEAISETDSYFSKYYPIVTSYFLDKSRGLKKINVLFLVPVYHKNSPEYVFVILFTLISSDYR